MSTFVLVHGAFHGAWCWEPVVRRLHRAGHVAEAIDLPGRELPDSERGRLTLSDYADAVAEAVSRQNDPVTLVGHSLGGMAITQAAEAVPERIAQLVYLAAFLPRDGEGVPQLISDAFRAGSLVLVNQTIDRAARVSRIDPAGAVAAAYSRTDPAVAVTAAARLVPEALGPQATPVHLTAARGGAVPRAYIETVHDATIPLAAQREMQAAAGVERVITLDTDHSPFLSAPEALATALMRL